MNDIAKVWVDNNATEFEQTVLWLATHDQECWDLFSRIVCRDRSGKFVPDFFISQHNAYYAAVEMARQSMASSPSVGPALFSSIVMSLAVKGDRIGRSEAPGVMALYEALAACDKRQMKALTKAALGYWINKQRSSVAMRKAVNSAAWDADLLVQDMNREISFTNNQLSEDNHVTEAADQLIGQRMPEYGTAMSTGLHGLDSALGGGYYQGEANLVIAAPGVGKTVFAAQLALYTAMQKKLVVFITTEQPADELTPRWLSNWCEYNFDNVSHGYDPRTLPREVLAKLVRMSQVIKNRIFIFDWKRKKKSVLAGGIEEEIDIAQDKSGCKCDLVIMDWLGGGLTDDVKDDKDKKRLALQNTSEKLADVAGQRKICAVAMAQAHKVKGIDNPYVGVAEVPENKTLDQPMTTVTGITGMRNAQAKDAIRQGTSPTGFETYSRDQYFYVSKCRKARGGHAACHRRFEYQKYVDGKMRGLG